MDLTEKLVQLIVSYKMFMHTMHVNQLKRLTDNVALESTV